MNTDETVFLESLVSKCGPQTPRNHRNTFKEYLGQKYLHSHTEM